MSSIFSRFSLTTASLLAACLIFGFIAGGVLIHRFETSPSASQQQPEQREQQSAEDNDSQTEDAQGDQGDKAPKAPGHSKATGGRTIEPPDTD